MNHEKKEAQHRINVLQQVKSALLSKNALKLKNLSNNTIHSASSHQDSASITIAVIVYTLSKLIERDDHQKIKNWGMFVKKFNSFLDLAIKAIEDDRPKRYADYMEKARKILESHAISLKQYIKDVLKKASINKGSKIYAHGISLEQTAKLLGVTQWELSDYIGQKTFDIKQERTIDVKSRAKMALEFFS